MKPLSPVAVAQLERYAELLAGDEQAPTAVRDPARVHDDHIADSLIALDLPEVAGAQRIADVGAGAGLPGIPLAVALPEARVVLVESNGRKCAFLDRTLAECGIDNAEVVYARAEEWREGLESCDLVVARALAPLPVVAEYAAPLLEPGGALVAWRGRRDPDDEAAGARAALMLGLEPREVVPVSPYPGALHRHLHVLVKVAPTPDRFPRRAGMARKRPLA